MINFLFGTDKMIFRWGFKKCAELGSIFYLGAFEGLILYAAFGAWGLVLIYNIINENKRKRASR